MSNAKGGMCFAFPPYATSWALSPADYQRLLNE
jgi:hypothetical protein